jgi:hypothetical protein
MVTVRHRGCNIVSFSIGPCVDRKRSVAVPGADVGKHRYASRLSARSDGIGDDLQAWGDAGPNVRSLDDRIWGAVMPQIRHLLDHC